MEEKPIIIEECYLYPVKGMTPVATKKLILETGRSPRGDRAFIFACANADIYPESGWVSKRESITILTMPELANIESVYDPNSRRLTLSLGREDQITGSIESVKDRQIIADWLAEKVKQFPKNPLRDRPEREPLKLLGNGETLFTDRGPSQISIGTRESLHDLSQRTQMKIDERRFRANLIVSGVEAWEEFNWTDRQFQIGEAIINITAPLVRCNVINASPQGYGSDLDLTEVLQREYGHINFGVEANVIKAGQVQAGNTMTPIS